MVNGEGAEALLVPRESAVRSRRGGNPAVLYVLLSATSGRSQSRGGRGDLPWPSGSLLRSGSFRQPIPSSLLVTGRARLASRKARRWNSFTGGASPPGSHSLSTRNSRNGSVCCTVAVNANPSHSGTTSTRVQTRGKDGLELVVRTVPTLLAGHVSVTPAPVRVTPDRIASVNRPRAPATGSAQPSKSKNDLRSKLARSWPGRRTYSDPHHTIPVPLPPGTPRTISASSKRYATWPAGVGSIPSMLAEPVQGKAVSTTQIGFT